ncbi:MAG: helix-turn-helix domain-containing protein [Actinocatenispora sp.]
MTVNDIRAAAADVFLARGYENATMADVAAQAGVTEDVVRERFADPAALLEAVLGPGFDDLETLLDTEDLTADEFVRRYVDLSLADRKALTLTMVQSGITTGHPVLGPRIRPLAQRMLAVLGATGDEASRVHAWAALAVIESTIAFQPDIPADRMRAPLVAAARGALLATA